MNEAAAIEIAMRVRGAAQVQQDFAQVATSSTAMSHRITASAVADQQAVSATFQKLSSDAARFHQYRRQLLQEENTGGDGGRGGPVDPIEKAQGRAGLMFARFASYTGGNERMLYTLSRGIEMVENQAGGLAGLGPTIMKALPIAGLAIGIGLIVRGLEAVGEQGKRSFEEAGVGSQGFFRNLEAGLGIIDAMILKMRAVDEVASSLTFTFTRQQDKIGRQITEGMSTTPIRERGRQAEEYEKAKYQKQIDSRMEDAKRFEEMRSKVGGMSRAERLAAFTEVNPDFKAPYKLWAPSKDETMGALQDAAQQKEREARTLTIEEEKKLADIRNNIAVQEYTFGRTAAERFEGWLVLNLTKLQSLDMTTRDALVAYWRNFEELKDKLRYASLGGRRDFQAEEEQKLLPRIKSGELSTEDAKAIAARETAHDEQLERQKIAMLSGHADIAETLALAKAEEWRKNGQWEGKGDTDEKRMARARGATFLQSHQMQDQINFQMSMFQRARSGWMEEAQQGSRGKLAAGFLEGSSEAYQARAEYMSGQSQKEVLDKQLAEQIKTNVYLEQLVTRALGGNFTEQDHVDINTVNGEGGR